MAKKEIISLLVKGGAAAGGPQLGPKLGPLGIKMNDVISKVNEKTATMKGMDVPVKIVIDPETRTFEVEVGTPPTSALLKKEADIAKGSGTAKTLYVSNIAIEQVIKIAKTKSENLLGSAMKQKVKEIVGTCVSLGIKVEGKEPKEILKEISAGNYDKEISEGKTEVPAEKLKTIQAEAKALREQAAAEAAKKAAEAEVAAVAPAAAPAEGGPTAPAAAAPAKEEKKKEEKKEKKPRKGKR
jgi:large subunit ribosomal protein L11